MSLLPSFFVAALLLLRSVNSEVTMFCCAGEATQGEQSQCNFCPVIKLIHDGEIEGDTIVIENKGSNVKVYQFLGIPYAEHPTRFAAPVKRGGWSTRMQTKKLPASCWQYIPSGFDMHNKGALMWTNNTQMNEDCLYLNIWAPSYINPNEKLPVMVWVYGGGFFSGSSTLEVYNGSILAATQNVIVVSMQYRVGAMGFLRVDPGDDEHAEQATGNEGLLDQKLALEWVQENIGLFGGDKSLVTLFGESAGAVSVSALWLAPKTQGLFKRAILQSASMYARWAYLTKDESQKRSRAFIQGCKCDPDADRQHILTCLRGLKPEYIVGNLSSIYDLISEERAQTLQKYVPNLYSQMKQSNIWTYLYFDAPLRPVVDGKFIPNEPDDMFLNRKGSEPPELLIGVNQNEGMYFLLYGLQMGNNRFLTEEGEVIWPQALEQWHNNGSLFLASTAQFIEKRMMNEKDSISIANFYGLRSENTTTRGREELMERMDALTGDLDFICPTLKFADKAFSELGARVYFYRFVKRTENFTMPRWVGVMHGYEIEYVFGMPRSDKFQDSFYRFTEEERKISDQMMEMWANFAREGNPIPDESTYKFEWPTYDQSDGSYLIINNTLSTGKMFRKRECEFWSNIESGK